MERLSTVSMYGLLKGISAVRIKIPAGCLGRTSQTECKIYILKMQMTENGQERLKK